MKKNLLLLVLPLLLAGCMSTKNPDTWLRGTLTRMEDGSVLEFRIQKVAVFGGSAAGGVLATDLKTGTQFTGQYVGMLNSGSSSGWANADAWGSGGWASIAATGGGRWQNDIANSQATLNDGQGNVIQIQMNIHCGFAPHGMGRGLDNKGSHYQVLF